MCHPCLCWHTSLVRLAVFIWQNGNMQPSWPVPPNMNPLTTFLPFGWIMDAIAMLGDPIRALYTFVASIQCKCLLAEAT